MQISRTPTLLVLSLAAIVSACAPIQHVTKEVVATTKAPAAIGPYSQAIRSGNLLFISSQIPIDPATNQIPPNADIEEQADHD